jgi:ATP-dependent Clp protease protease subunit|tara:strand:- start:8283 stop:9269 length:987 start_codon:yes stop_codon:yes gene_type:complete
MTDKPQASGKPAAVQTINGRPAPGKPAPINATPLRPRGVAGKVMGRDRPAALPMPATREVYALSKPNVLDRWNEVGAGIRAVARGDNVITMFGDIGQDWWSDTEITAKTVTAQLRAIGERDVEVHINSGGGDMFEGIAIFNVLREHPHNVTVKVMGMAASAASVIAMAGDTIEIGAASFFMIHNCWVGAVGNRHDMIEVAAFLEPFDRAMADTYASRTGSSVDDVVKWMDAETWMSGSVALERGFAQALLSADQMTVDEKAKAKDLATNELRAMELTLVAAGHTRTDARARINKIKGTPGAAHDTVDTPGAADKDLVLPLAGLLEAFR